MQLQFNGQLIANDEAYDFGLADLSLITDLNGTLILVGVSRGSGGLVAWDMTDMSDPELASMRGADTEFASGTGPTLVELNNTGGAGLLVTGLQEGGVILSEPNGHGGLRPAKAAWAEDENWTTGVQLDSGLIALACADGSGFSLFDKIDDSSVALQADITDTGETHASAITAMASMGDILIVGSATEYGISSYATSGTTVTAVSSFGPDSGIGIMVPTAISIVQIDGQGFAIVGSAGGSSGALSVFSIGVDGSLIPTDHAMDTLNSRFGAVQDVASVAWGDGALVVAGGGDDGLTVMALMPNGRLIHLASFEDTLTLALSGVTALELHLVGDVLKIFATSQSDGGISIMSLDLGDVGAWDIGSDGLLSGTGDDDILMTGTAAATLDGGSGADILVISEDGDATHKIRNFDPTEDRINLADWSFLYDANSLSFQTIWNGVIITHRGETLIVTGVGNQPLSIEDVRDTIEIDMTRLPTIPNDTITGSNASDILTGNWAADVMFGEGGADTLYGGAGDDRLEGGDGWDHLFGDEGADDLHGGVGNDTLIGGIGNDTIFGGDGFDRALLTGDDFAVLAYDAAAETVTLQTDDGVDTFDNIEVFTIGGTDYTFADLAPPPLSIYGTDGDDTLVGGDDGVTLVGRDGDDVVTGGSGDDTIKGGGGADTITGNAGADDILAGAGNDTLYGGSGDDILNAGADDDVIVGGEGVDTFVGTLNAARMFVLDWSADSVTLQSSIGIDVISGVEFFEFEDTILTLEDLAPDTSRPIIKGTGDIDRITDEAGSCEIFSYGGDDAVRAGSGSDYIVAGSGDDRVWGGTGRDQIYGGSGDDRLQGEAGNDMVYGGGGNDLIRGQANNDLLSGGNDDDIIYGGDGHDLLMGDSGNDFLSGGVRRDQLWGGDGSDDLRGGDHEDILWGGTGNDALRGGEDDDILYGGDGSDSLLGGAGLDTLTGGAGDDIMSGGGDRDTFLFNADHGEDHITDFNMLRDTLVLDAQLVGEATSGQDVVDLFGAETAQGFALYFDDGSSITFDGVTLTDDFANSISII